MSKYTDEEWEEIGRKWREAAKMDGAVPFDALAFVRWLKHAGHIKDYIRVPDDGLPFAEGKYDPDREVIIYRESVWRAAERSDPHATWTVVHECCHALRKHKEHALPRRFISSKSVFC
jgi:hypothetical protein